MRLPTTISNFRLIAITPVLAFLLTTAGFAGDDLTDKQASQKWQKLLEAVAAGQVSETNLPSAIPMSEFPAELFITDLELSAPSPPQMVKAVNNPESQPARLDTNGHWGEVLFGFQVGLRFSKSTFTNGEPVNAIVYLRNASDAQIFWPPIDGPEVGAVALSKMGILRSAETEPSGPSVKPYVILPHSQKRFTVRLDEIVAIKRPGEYQVWAQIPVAYPRNCPPGTKIKVYSAVAIIRITDSPE